MRVPRRLTAALALAAAASLGVPVHALGATVASRTTARARCADPVVAAPVGGEAAVQELGTDLAEAADNVDRTPGQYRRLLRSDATLRVDQCAQTFVVEKPLSAGQQAATEAAASEPAPIRADAPLNANGDAFSLSSRPGSNRTIFLDFDGALVSGTVWNSNPANPVPARFAPGFDTDGSPGTYTESELDTIRRVWLRVAEDYAPFDVNVTTSDPGQPAITRSGRDDATYGTRALITSDEVLHHGVCPSGCGGVAYLGVFDTPASHDVYQPALVFPSGSGRSDKGIAEAAAHEVGHSLGLSHDGITKSGVTSDYYTGNGLWAPIMGAGYYAPVTQWSRGTYAGATNHEDDLAVMGQNGVSAVPDDHPDVTADATRLVYGGAAVDGVIGTSADRDRFAFSIPDESTSATLSVKPQTIGPDLDVTLTIYPPDSGNVITVDPPAVAKPSDKVDGLDATLTRSLSPGDYTAEVTGAASSTSLPTAYDKYASLGRYAISLHGEGGELAVSTTTLPPATVGVDYDLGLTASGGTGPYTWTSDDLPSWLELGDDELTGIPIDPVDTTIHVTVADHAGATATATLDVDVVAPPVHVVTVEDPPTATPVTPPATTTVTPTPDPTPTSTPTTPPPVSKPPVLPTTFAGTLAQAVALLPVRPESTSGYAAARFPLVDADHDCRTTRTEALQAQSRRKVTWSAGRHCTIRTGSWLSLLDRRAATKAAQMTAVWTVPLTEAWQSGARGWPTARRQAYANDLADRRTLLAVTARSARTRADREPTGWLPGNASRCAYVADWVAVKLRWGLSADRAEQARLAAVAGSTACRSTRVVVHRR